ncbi:hypothetical protein LZZ90_00935 [Flavobacterium sp. SM15]|uniref:hypothetical protein n=1 Tax=Flavobacterium sp. SM15 TaxID=2908005 RepID=UPI001EDA6413|nr:hypothetical protein [Flavobacterium sp. SM15]MCG2610065.1 hypothetical protein [Flavobacterium sp. SM15]
MLKNILNLEGAQALSISEQKTITGGITDNGKAPVPPGLICCEWIIMCGSQICIREDVVCETTSEM